MTIGRLLPARLRHHSRVVSIQCRLCGQWHKTRHIRIPAMVCRDCEHRPVFQAWESPNRVSPRTLDEDVGAGWRH
jgi:hypothetical protein